HDLCQDGRMKIPGTRPWRALSLVAFWASSPAFADTFTETFDGGSNAGSWHYGGPGEVIETSGGNPGASLPSPTPYHFAPQPRTAPGFSSVFTGDYRGKNVTAIGIDLITIAVDFSA